MDRPDANLTLSKRLAAVLCTVSLVLPSALSAGTAAAQDPSDKEHTRQRLGEVADELEGARQELHDIKRDHGLTQADLEVIDAKRARLTAELQRLNNDLWEAQVELQHREAALAHTNARLGGTKDKLRDTRSKLARSEDQFAQRTRASYMQGGTGYTGFVLDVDDMGDFAETVTYVRAVMASDRAQIERVDGLRKEVGATIEQLELLRQDQVQQRQEAAAERDRVAGIVAEREAVQARADAEAERYRAVLAQLDADRRAYEQKVAGLEGQSARLEDRLRAIAEEERRRAAEERRRARAAARQAAQEAAAERRRAAGAADRSGPAPAPQPEPAQPVSSSGFIRPVSGGVTSGFGYRTHPITGTTRLHTGWDMSAGYGQPIVAAASGTVFSAGWLGGYGNCVVILHSGGIGTLYAHQSSLAVSSGQSVSQGQLIGYVGSTGFSTGPHLHFEVRVNGTPVDPSGYL